MQIDLLDTAIAVLGENNAIARAATAALTANGGRIVADAPRADILLVSCPLVAAAPQGDLSALLRDARAAATAMSARDHGRILFLLPALAALPMRRHPLYGAEMAGILALMRGFAMQFGPRVLVNAVGLGPIAEETLIAGDPAQLSHIPQGRPGTIAEAVAAILFFCDPLNTYTTGQMLAVDGGWSAGYGRNF